MTSSRGKQLTPATVVFSDSWLGVAVRVRVTVYFRYTSLNNRCGIGHLAQGCLQVRLRKLGIELSTIRLGFDRYFTFRIDIFVHFDFQRLYFPPQVSAIVATPACHHLSIPTPHMIGQWSLCDSPVTVQKRLAQTLSAGFVEPLATASTLQHLEVPSAKQEHHHYYYTWDSLTTLNATHWTLSVFYAFCTPHVTQVREAAGLAL